MTTSTIHWAIGPNLGVYRASNNYSIPLSVVDSDSSVGSITYTAVGTLPPSLQLDSETGYLWGYAEYQSDYIQSYSFTVNATKTFIDLTTASTSSVFTMDIKGFVDTNIQWITTSSLGSIEVGFPSDLSVEAVETVNNFAIRYNLVSGNLPLGLTLTQDGAICGQVEYGTTGTFTFTVSAITDYDNTGTNRTFQLVSQSSEATRYTKIYVRPFLSKEKRKEYQLFINNPEIFQTDLIYRYFDPNFGVQSDIKMILDFGIEQILLDQYTQALRQNFYKRRFTLGKIKTAVAKDDAGTTIYEVIYADVVDNLKTVALNLYSNQTISVSYEEGQAKYSPADPDVNNIYQPASVNNMRYRLGKIQLDDWSTIKVNSRFEPQFMRTPQTGNSLPTNYIPVVPLCYVKPGKSKQILKKIAASGFKFNLIDFEIDRLIVQNSLDNSTAKYLLFGRESISDTLATDFVLYQGDVSWQFNDGVQLTRNS